MNIERSVVTLKAKPCMVMPRVILTPMAPILFDPTHTPVFCGSRARLHAQVGGGTDQDLLEVAEVLDHVVALAESEDRITDELPGSVIGRTAPPVDPEQRDAERRALRLAVDEVFLEGPSSQRVRVRMFQEHHRVSALPIQAGQEELLLPGPRGGIVNSSEPCGRQEIALLLRCLAHAHLVLFSLPLV